METKKKYKIFPWWLITLLIISVLQTLNNIGKYGFNNCELNWVFIGILVLIIFYRTSNKQHIEEDNNSDNLDNKPKD